MSPCIELQYIPRNMHTVFALLCFVVAIHWLIIPYPSGLLHWHCGNLTIAPVPAKQPWWIWINTSCEFIMNDCITTTKQSTTKPCAYFLGYTVPQRQQTICKLPYFAQLQSLLSILPKVQCTMWKYFQTILKISKLTLYQKLCWVVFHLMLIYQNQLSFYTCQHPK